MNYKMGNCCKPQIPNINIKDICQNIECKTRCLSSCCIKNEKPHHKHHHKHQKKEKEKEKEIEIEIYG